VNSPAAVRLHKQVIVRSFQLRLRPGGVYGQRRFRLAYRRQHQSQLIEQVLHFGLRAVDYAVAVIVHQREVERIHVRTMAGLASANHLLGRNLIGPSEAHLESMTANLTKRRIGSRRRLRVASYASVLHDVAVGGTRNVLAVGEAVGSHQHVGLRAFMRSEMGAASRLRLW